MRILTIIAVALAAVTTGTSSAQEANPPDDLNLVGNRFPPLTWENMTDAQRTMVMHILDGPRSSLGGPFNVTLRSPQMGDALQELGTFARFNTMPGKLRELAILITARFWTSHFEWYAHRNAAIREGLDPTIVEAIAVGEMPEDMDAEESVVYALVSELLYDRRVSDATFESAIDALGERAVVDVVGIVGYYGMVSLFLNIDEYPLPEGVEPQLQPMR